MRQLALPFTEQEDYAEDDFCAAPSNALALRWLERPGDWTGGRLVLWGEPGCGKTHLLNIWARRHGAALIRGDRFLPVGPAGLLAVDDADLVTDEAGLLHLLNAAAEAGQPVLLAARLPPARQTLRLADLASRLRASETAEIRAPEDELLAALLARLTAERQLRLTPAVRNLLLDRLPRTPAALREAVARLEHAAANGRRLTGTLAAGLLADIAWPAEARPAEARRDDVAATVT